MANCASADSDQITYSASSDMDGHVCLGISVLIHVLQVNTRYLFFYKLIASDTHWKYLKSGNSNQYPKCFHLERQKKKKLLALREVGESKTPKNCPGTSKNQCQEVWDSQLLKVFSHL